MPTLHLFNPENDLALAHNDVGYTVPPSAMRLHNAGATLPLWFSEKEDLIIAPHADLDWIKYIKSQFDIPGNIASPNSIDKISHCAPWGWSHNTCQQFINYGIDSSLLPDEEIITKIKELSHRRLTIKILQELTAKYPFINIPLPFEARNDKEVLDFANKYKSIFIKSPWSSSGRGIFNASKMSATEICRQVNGIIRRQGSVLCEVALNKTKDFAMLFYSDGEKVEYRGLSSFICAENGAYTGNIIASQENIEQSLNLFNTTLTLTDLANSLCDILTALITPFYNGYLGVDMMIYHNGNKHEIAPCVEVNLRMTMGIVAMIWSQRYLSNGATGLMRVEFSPQQKYHKTISTEQPIIINKKLKSGTISLIPPDNNFKITIEVS